MSDSIHPSPDPAGAAPAPLSDQQEAFCQAYVVSANAAQAAREAGYAASSARQSAHRLLAKLQVTDRIEQLRETMAAQGCRTAMALLGKLENVHNRALDAGQYAAAARTVEIQARLAGLMPSIMERRHVIRGQSATTAENGDFPESGG